MPNWIESDRLAALDRYEILDTPQESDFDNIVKLAAQICDVPIASIRLVSEDREWFKASVALSVRETPRDISFCHYAIQQRGLFEVPDAAADACFSGNPLVAGEPGIRFYTSAILKTPEGYPLGTLCVLDTRPRRLEERQRFALKILADQVMAQLKMRRLASEHMAAGARPERRPRTLPGCGHERLYRQALPPGGTAKEIIEDAGARSMSSRSAYDL